MLIAASAVRSLLLPHCAAASGNYSPGSRRTYVIAFRVEDTVRRERAAGFPHSHNDEVNWDVFNKWKETAVRG